MMLQELVISSISCFNGNGWNIPKIMHEQLNVPFYIQMIGAHQNLHIRPTEHNDIVLSKQPAQQRQGMGVDNVQKQGQWGSHEI
jgi:hypothetical protein